MTTPSPEAAAREDGSVRAPAPVKSAERTLRLLEILGASPGAMPVTELHERTGYPRSSLHQLLHTLVLSGWASLSADGTRVAIGTRALVVGTSYLDRDGALRHARRTLEEVRDATGYTTHYARLDGADVIYLATREALDSRRAASRVGRQLPAGATALGKALLAELTDAEVATLLPDPLPRLTGSTAADLGVLTEQLAQVRARGCAIEREENTPGVACVGAVVPYRIPATDALSCSIPLDRAAPEELERVGELLQRSAAALAAGLRATGVR